MDTKLQQMFLNRLKEKAIEIDDYYQTIYEALGFDVPDDRMIPMEGQILNELSEAHEELLLLILDTQNFIFDMEIELDKILGNREGLEYDI